jgi:DNA-binding transcriptional MerR regulator
VGIGNHDKVSSYWRVKVKIGELSARTGLPVRTLRFYEAEGLLQSERTPGNYREFPVSAIAQAERIRMYRALDLSLPEIRSMLELSKTPERSCSEVCRLIEGHLGNIVEQRRRLEELETELRRLLAICPGSAAPDSSGCKILAEFQGRVGQPRHES